MLLLRHNGWQHCGPGGSLVTTCAAAGADDGHYWHTTILIWSGLGEQTSCDWSLGHLESLWLALNYSDQISARVSRTQPRQDTELTTSSPSRLPNFRHNNLLILKLLPGPRTACESPWSAALSPRIIPGTGLSSPLSLICSPRITCHRLSPDWRWRVTFVTWCNTSEGWHVMTPRQRGNEVKIGQIRIILRMRVASWLPIINPGLHCTESLLSHALTDICWALDIILRADHFPLVNADQATLNQFDCAALLSLRGWCEGSGPSSQPRLLIQILTINCTLMVVYPFVVPNSPPEGIQSCFVFVSTFILQLDIS